ncbi:uncharacterized protein [Musca autumnalis]|uniref:uncharacterized protein n=1 Tax=Musca autumnalis TaxID=221902 RepID=UPI003CF8DA50
MIRIDAKPITINVIQVYAPSSDKSSEEVEAFYDEIEELLQLTKQHEITIIQGDFKAKVGREVVTGVTGQYGLGERNVPSDHNLFMGNIYIKLSAPAKKKQHRKFDIGKLDNPATKLSVRDLINLELNSVNRNDVEHIWGEVKNTLQTIGQNNLGNYKRSKDKDWMTNEIQELLSERRRYKNSYYEMYWELNREIQMKIRAAKIRHINSQCQEIETLQNLHDDFNLHKKLKEATGIYHKTMSPVLYNNNNEPAFENAEKQAIWKNYIQSLFTDVNRSSFNNQSAQPMTGTNITKSEVESAITSLKTRKATGPDEIPSEMLKLMDENNIGLLTRLMNHVYNTCHYPQDWLKSFFPKKSHAKHCGDNFYQLNEPRS